MFFPWTFWITLLHHLFVFLPHFVYKSHVWSILRAPGWEEKATMLSTNAFEDSKSLSKKSQGRHYVCPIPMMRQSCRSMSSLVRGVIKPNLPWKMLVTSWMCWSLWYFQHLSSKHWTTCRSFGFCKTSTKALSLGGALENWCEGYFFVCLWSHQTKRLPS